MPQDENRKVKGSLIGIDGNAFIVMGHFRKLAKQQGFSKDWIDGVIAEAKSGDYENLLRVIDGNMED